MSCIRSKWLSVSGVCLCTGWGCIVHGHVEVSHGARWDGLTHIEHDVNQRWGFIPLRRRSALHSFTHSVLQYPTILPRTLYRALFPTHTVRFSLVTTRKMASVSPIADVNASSDPNDKHLVIRQITPDIITFSQPFSRGGMAIGGRGTAVKLPSSEIFLYVSTPHSPATAETIAKMGGEVKWLVTPDGEHGIFFDEYIKAYPNAQ